MASYLPQQHETEIFIWSEIYNRVITIDGCKEGFGETTFTLEPPSSSNHYQHWYFEKVNHNTQLNVGYFRSRACSSPYRNMYLDVQMRLYQGGDDKPDKCSNGDPLYLGTKHDSSNGFSTDNNAFIIHQQWEYDFISADKGGFLINQNVCRTDDGKPFVLSVQAYGNTPVLWEKNDWREMWWSLRPVSCPNCVVEYPNRIGDGIRHPNYNTEECLNDGDDCTVPDATFSPSRSPAESPSRPPKTDTHESSKISKIVGIVVGVLAGAALLFGLAAHYNRRRTVNSQRPHPQAPDQENIAFPIAVPIHSEVSFDTEVVLEMPIPCPSVEAPICPPSVAHSDSEVLVTAIPKALVEHLHISTT